MPNYYLVDTNIIISYVKREDTKLVNFVDIPDNHFFYTETVRKELSVPSNQIRDIPDKFTFIDTHLNPLTIKHVVDWIADRMRLTPSQKNKFMNDLSIILEAGYVCYEVTPPNDYTEPYLLTHNLKLYEKFINYPTNKRDLEEIIGLNGLEHLIEVKRPQDVIAGY
jgi:hypothetical protein